MDSIINFEYEYSFFVIVLVHAFVYFVFGRDAYRYSGQLDIIHDAEWAMHICFGSAMLLNVVVATTILVPSSLCHYLVFWPTFLFCMQLISYHTRSWYCIVNMLCPENQSLKQKVPWILFFVCGLVCFQGFAFFTIDDKDIKDCLIAANMCYVPVSIISSCYFTMIGLASSFLQLCFVYKLSKYLFIETMLLTLLQGLLSIASLVIYTLAMKNCELSLMPIVRILLVLYSLFSLLPALFPFIYLHWDYWMYKCLSTTTKTKRNYHLVEQSEEIEMNYIEPTTKEKNFTTQWVFLNEHLELLKTEPWPPLHDTPFVNRNMETNDAMRSILLFSRIQKFAREENISLYLDIFLELLQFKDTQFKGLPVRLQFFQNLNKKLLDLSKSSTQLPRFPEELVQSMAHNEDEKDKWMDTRLNIYISYFNLLFTYLFEAL